MVGIKETKDVIIAVNELALVIIKHVRDGFQVTDIVAVITELIGTDSFKTAIADAVSNIAQVPAEIKDIDLIEGGELAICQAMYLPRILEALKK